MQSDSSSTSGGSRDSPHSESDGEQPAKSGFSITPQDRVVLQEYLEEFQEADPDERTRIIERAMAKLYHLRPVNTPFDKKDASKKIQKWFYNKYVRPRRQYIKFTRKWSARNAFYHLNRDEVLDHVKKTSGIEPGDPAFLGVLQDATTTLWKELSPMDQQDYVKAAREWSEETPPKRVQSRMASSMRERIIQDFQIQLHKTCGIRSLVLTAYEAEDNTLKIGLNDVSTVLQDGKSFRKYCPDWKSAALWEQWIKFGQKCFSNDTVQELPKKDRSRTINTPIPIVFDKYKCPKLPKVTMFDGYKAKVVQSLLREYCTAHIRFVTGNKKQTIPWGVLVKDPSSWILDDCTPEEFVWKDPSKIQIGEVFRLLSHWSDRQDQGLGPLMWVPTSPLFRDVKHPRRHRRHLRYAQQSNASDQESFNLSNYGDSNPKSSSTDKSSAESSDSDPPHNRTSDVERETTEPSNTSSSSDESSDHAMATETPPFHEPAKRSDPGSDGTPHSPGNNYQGDDRYSSPDMAGPSDPYPVQQERNQINNYPLAEEGKRVVIPTEKVKNMDTGRGAAKIHPSFLASASGIPNYLRPTTRNVPIEHPLPIPVHLLIIPVHFASGIPDYLRSSRRRLEYQFRENLRRRPAPAKYEPLKTLTAD
ncbi:hypothetical protein EDB85DRAFT_1888399 [Lactarius pseudohatsudake]|nr:hypothetical protein EDB85DRAFT_1888399 [Lactarius pseudohatsudake]